MNVNKYLRNPYAVFDRITGSENFHWLSHKTYLELKFKGQLGYRLNLDAPKTFNDHTIKP